MPVSSQHLASVTQILMFLQHRPSRRLSAVWPSKTSYNFCCTRCLQCSHGANRPRSPRNSRLNSWGLLMHRSRWYCRHRCARRVYPITGCRWRCHLCTASQVDHASSHLATEQCTSRGIAPQRLHRLPMQWSQYSHRQWRSTMCHCHCRRLVLWALEFLAVS